MVRIHVYKFSFDKVMNRTVSSFSRYSTNILHGDSSVKQVNDLLQPPMPRQKKTLRPGSRNSNCISWHQKKKTRNSVTLPHRHGTISNIYRYYISQILDGLVVSSRYKSLLADCNIRNIHQRNEILAVT